MGSSRFHGHPDHDACGVGFVAQLGSLGSRDVIERALTALVRLTHRGGVDADGSSGDGAGLLLPIPKEFFRARAREERLSLPAEFGIGMAFLPPGQVEEARASIEKLSGLCDVHCCGWREVPVDHSVLGPSASATLPAIYQVFFSSAKTGEAFYANEVELMLIRHDREERIFVTFVYAPVIDKDGKVSKVTWSGQSGVEALDRAAVAAISASNPFPPLPPEFKGDRVVLQLNFAYNMPKQ